MATWRIEHGDCLDVLRAVPESSIDAGVTDPPYGIGFMGREWDTFRPDVPRKQAERLIQGEPMVSDNPNLNGRRRSPAISESQIFYDRTLRGQRAFQSWTEGWAREVLRVLKPGAHIVVCGAPRSYHRMACGLEDAGFEIRDGLQWIFGQGFPKSLNLGDGFGTALKPAHEPIVLARKPVIGTIAANREAFGTGALNIDACRGAGDGWAREDGNSGAGFYSGKFMGAAGVGEPTQVGGCRSSNIGRWPANVLFDEAAAALLDEQSGELHAGNYPSVRGKGGMWSGHAGHDLGDAVRTDAGGASRFFYVAKPDRAERDNGCAHLDERTTDPYAEHRGRRMPEGSERFDGEPAARGRNFHPTVKPIALMQWLCRLITPPDGTILDPFLGSGTTGIAALREGFGFIGIEREEEYIGLARARIIGDAPLLNSEHLA